MAPKNKKIFTAWNTFLFILVICVIIGIYMVFNGALNYQRITKCKDAPVDTFCGLKVIDLSIDKSVNKEIIKQVDLVSGKKVVIPGWKAGRTISTSDVKKDIPILFDWYVNLEDEISDVIGERVYITSDTLPTTCSVLIYEDDGDFINWHYDVNYFNGRFFTLLVPCTITDSCTEYTYYDKDNNKQSIKDKMGKSILFEGDKVFHMATEFCNKGEKRVMVSMQFSTNPTIEWYNRALMRIKDIAYIG